MVILSASVFAVLSMYHSTKYKSPSQLVFYRDMILPINHVVDLRYIYLSVNKLKEIKTSYRKTIMEFTTTKELEIK